MGGTRTMKSRIAITAFVCMPFILMSFTLTRVQNLPRHGDSLQREELKSSSVTTDSLGNNVDLSKSVTIREWHIQYHLPAKKDTVSAMLVTTEGKSVCHLVDTQYGLASLDDIKAGQQIHYSTPFPEFVLTRDTSAYFSGNGRKGSLSEIELKGKWTFSSKSGTSVITQDCDTLKNLLCTALYAEGNVFWTIGDSITDYKYHSLRKQWYASGYRYPILELTEHSIYDKNSKTLDTDNRWTYFSPLSQEEQLKEDPDNEEIREFQPIQYDKPSKSGNRETNPDRKTGYDNQPFIGDNGFSASSIWKKETQIAEITISSTKHTAVQLCLYDAGGKLLQMKTKKLSGWDKFNFNLHQYASGTYLIIVESEAGNASFKFINP